MGARALFPGTFDPVIVAVYDKPLKSLVFSPEERIAMVSHSFSGINNLEVVGYSGLTVAFARKANVQVIVRGLRVFSDFEYEFRMALANHRLAPEIEVVSFITNEEHTFLSSTTVREIASLGGDVSSMVPPHVEAALKRRFHELGDGQQIVPATSLRD
jgi:pantetheine-phosphate adenylyltransferase